MTSSGSGLNLQQAITSSWVAIDSVGQFNCCSSYIAGKCIRWFLVSRIAVAYCVVYRTLFIAMATNNSKIVFPRQCVFKLGGQQVAASLDSANSKTPEVGLSRRWTGYR